MKAAFLLAHGVRTSCVRVDWMLTSRSAISRTIGSAERLHGMHFQALPCAETKIVRCTRGSIHDVIVDLRPGSNTYRRWFAVQLTSENRRAIYVPAEFAHGFLTLEDDSEVFYQMSPPHVPESASGVRWNDPAFGIEWPFLRVIGLRARCVLASAGSLNDAIRSSNPSRGVGQCPQCSRIPNFPPLRETGWSVNGPRSSSRTPHNSA